MGANNFFRSNSPLIIFIFLFSYLSIEDKVLKQIIFCSFIALLK